MVRYTDPRLTNFDKARHNGRVLIESEDMDDDRCPFDPCSCSQLIFVSPVRQITTGRAAR
jgi:hypothetical protein